MGVIPAKHILDPDRGAGLWIPDKPCGLSGMTKRGYAAAVCGGNGKRGRTGRSGQI